MEIPKKQLRKFLGKLNFAKSLNDVIRLEISFTITSKKSTKHTTLLRFQQNEDTSSYVLDCLDGNTPRQPSDEDFNADELCKRARKIYQNVQDYWMRVEPQTQWDDLIHDFNEARIKWNGALQLEDAHPLLVRARSGYGYDAHLIPAIFALAFCLEADQALQNGSLPHALFCVQRGEYWSSDDFQPRDPHQAFRDRASKGGYARAEKYYDGVKEEVIRLLGKSAPNEGWKYASDAVTALKAPILQFIDSQQADREVTMADLTYSNLTFTLYRWICEDPQIRDAFQKNRKK